MTDPRDADPIDTDDTAPRSALPSAWWWLAVVLSGLMVLVLALTAVVSAVKAAEKDARRNAPSQPAFLPETSALTSRVGGVIDDGPPAENDEGDVEAVAAFFKLLNTTLRDPNATVEDLIDWSDMTSELPDDVATLPGLDDGTERDALWCARTVVQGETSQWKRWNWEKVQVRKVVRREGGGVVDAVVWHPTADGKVVKRRWTFSPAPDGFLALGWEDLRTGLTAKDRTHARACGSLSPSVRRQRQSQLDDVTGVHRLVDERNWESARRMVDRLRAIRFDGGLQYPVDLAEARLAFSHRLSSQGEWDQDLAVEILEDLVTRHPERLAAHFWLAEVHLLGEEYPRVIEVCDGLLGVTGDDPDALAMRAAARHALLQPAEAKADFEAALALDPHQPRALNWQREEADAAGKKAIAGKLATAPDPRGLFDALNEWATDDGDWPAVQALAEKYRSLRPKDPRWGWPLIESLVRQGQPEKATEPFLQALSQSDPADRERLVLQFTTAMIETRKADAVYAVIPKGEAAVAFRRLAEHYEMTRGRQPAPSHEALVPKAEVVKPLVELIDAHRKQHPTDPRLALHDGRLKIDQRQYDKAVEVLSPAVAAATPTGDAVADWKSGYSALLSELLLAQYKRGKALDAYRELKHNPDVFAELAERYVTDKDGRGLNALLDERAKAKADPADELFWRAEGYRLNGKHDLAAANYKQYLAAKGEFLVYGHRARTGRCRSLLKTGEFATAAKEFGEPAGDDLPIELRAAVLAKANRAAVAEQLLRDHLATLPWTLARFYADDDLGPLLRGPDFATFRKDFPPPAQNK